MVKAFIINLKESTDRRSFMEAQLLLFPEVDYQFLDAINARELADEAISVLYDEKRALKVLNRPMVRGEIGVALSQLDAMKRITANHDYALIMEDDLLLSPYFSESLQKAIDYINQPQPSIVLFTPIPQYSVLDRIIVNELQRRCIYKIWRDASAAACYLINKSACQVILDEYPKVFNVIDNWGYFLAQRKIDIRAVVPHVVAFSKYGLHASTINLDNDRDSKVFTIQQHLSILQRIKIKLGNFIQYRIHQVRKSPDVWYNSFHVIQSNF
ncbi:MAG: glycosyltransferase family 25 protein [Candidatus Marinimicrobia bacterium]|nr:glycosyltransferase family 25 protein [Candidatus Neomarinimicrobiota bacterium]